MNKVQRDNMRNSAYQAWTVWYVVICTIMYQTPEYQLLSVSIAIIFAYIGDHPPKLAKSQYRRYRPPVDAVNVRPTQYPKPPEIDFEAQLERLRKGELPMNREGTR